MQASLFLNVLSLDISSLSCTLKCLIFRLFSFTKCAVISQWAIFAIRNILEQNQENQALVAAMDRRGNADYSALSELGLDIEKRAGALLLKTTKKH